MLISATLLLLNKNDFLYFRFGTAPGSEGSGVTKEMEELKKKAAT